MAESICRVLRDGALEGEHAPALTIKDSIQSPFGSLVFNHVLTQLSTNILAAKSQSRGVVLVALSRSPSFYADLLRSKGNEVNSSRKWLRILDCYSDPFGWKDRLIECGSIANSSPSVGVDASLCKDVRDFDKLFVSILELGKGAIGEGKGRFSVAIDSNSDCTVGTSFTQLACLYLLVSELLRHTSMSSVAGLLSNLRSHDQVSCLFWLLHEDLHEIKVTAALEYMSSMLATIECTNRSTSVQSDNCEKNYLVDQNFNMGKFHTRLKRRNGRVRVACEEFLVEQSGIKFKSFSPEDGVAQSLVPKVQFNLQLSEKERSDRAKVVLPFEHQGNGKSIQIYDGRKSLADGKIDTKPMAVEKVQSREESGGGEIIYFRDSDDEMPDSDEDPDDDLDI